MKYEPTLVLEEGYLDKKSQPAETPSASAQSGAPVKTDTTSTRVISREMVLEGVKFNWWAVGEKPCLVTVKSPLFGSKAEFTRGDPEDFAARLARQLLTESFERAAERRRDAAERSAPQDPDVLKKAGWFDGRED